MNSKLTLSTKLTAQGKTGLEEYFASPPFKVMILPSYEDCWENALNAMQMSSSPGLLAGDRLNIQIRLAENTGLSLHTQAFTRVQSMHEDSFAEQITRIQLSSNSRLFYLPHPLVLHKESCFKQKTMIEMADDSQLIYGEIVAIGRVLNDERFAFRQFSSHLKIYKEKRPLVSDCIQWVPQTTNLTALSQMEEYSHQGSLYFLHTGKSAVEIKEILTALQARFVQQHDMLLGTSQLNAFGFLVRVLAHKAETIQNLFKEIGLFLKRQA